MGVLFHSVCLKAPVKTFFWIFQLFQYDSDLSSPYSREDNCQLPSVFTHHNNKLIQICLCEVCCIWERVREWVCERMSEEKLCRALCFWKLYLMIRCCRLIIGFQFSLYLIMRRLRLIVQIIFPLNSSSTSMFLQLKLQSGIFISDSINLYKMI